MTTKRKSVAEDASISEVINEIGELLLEFSGALHRFGQICFMTAENARKDEARRAKKSAKGKSK